MPQANKFGTFAGVYTPSVLTILGVIMYMRLGWVVGSAGLYAALAIIIISHVISISTSLSISSIATDKRIRTGGIYYILSRSLGLPMGGSIGITLFIGTALSISLYIIGFAESFLSLETVREYTGLSQDVISYQILGSIILVMLTVLALISTSLALKVQFYILAAIGISIVSIGIGIWLNIDSAPVAPLLKPAPNAPSMEMIFGIFFPAVTGFTAGVAMSGDLRDPKKSIPKGTMLAVATGFVVYIGLTFLFAFFVNRDTLVNNSNFITEIAAVGLLVYLGIWGATLSSALGGILGAPRIMQAIASDKIAPKIFAKGRGPENEPQNALILTFVISELGILLGGDINAIASVVSMFYLASYAFINVAFTLEKWASTDFRPSFKIPTFIGAVGAIAAFVLMFRLDPVSMSIALALMGLIYFLLRRKEIKLEKGDVWQSVWSSIIRTALHRMDKREIEERNWQPNIILFSGGTSKRPHLIEFGKALVGRYGMLSNFDLHEVPDQKILFSKPTQKVVDDAIAPGIFTRRQSCSDIYQGVEMISHTYGFSGVEPNTVLLGWGRTSKNPARFMEMINTLSELDLNILMLDYDKGSGFGEYKLIDIWWRDLGRHGNLALILTRFIWSSDEWRDAKVRLMIVNPSNDATDQIYREALDVVETMRINAEIKVINNEIEQKPFYDIVRSESRDTDLIVVGIPEISAGLEVSFVEDTSRLMKDLGTVLLIKASSLFKPLSFGVSQEKKKVEIFSEADEEKDKRFEIARKELPKNSDIADGLEHLVKGLNKISDDFYESNFRTITQVYTNFITSLKNVANETFDRLEHRVVDLEAEMQVKGIRRLQNSFLLKTRKLIMHYLDEGMKTQTVHLKGGVEAILEEFDDLMQDQQDRILENYSLDDLERALKTKGGIRLKWFIRRKQLQVQISGHPAEYSIHFRTLVEQHLPQKVYAAFYESLHKFGMANLEMYIHLMRFFRMVHNSLQLLEKLPATEGLSLAAIKIERNFVQKEFDLLDKLFVQMQERMPLTSKIGVAQACRKLSEVFFEVHPNRHEISSKTKTHQYESRTKLGELALNWQRNQNLLYQVGRVELMLVSLDGIVRSILRRLADDILHIYQNVLLSKLSELEGYLKHLEQESISNKKLVFKPGQVDFSKINETLWINLITQTDAAIKEIKVAVEKLPRQLDMLSDQSFNNFHKDQFESEQVVQVAANRITHAIVDEKVTDPLHSFMNRLPDRLQRTVNKATDVIRFISFNLQGETLDQIEGLDSTNITAMIKEQIRNVELLIATSKEEQQKATDQLNSIMNDLSTQLNVYTFTRAPEKLKQYVKGSEKTRLYGFRKFFRTRIETTVNLLNQIWFRKSEALLIAQNLQDEKLPNTSVNELLNQVEKMSPRADIFTKLPFYYQQLFLRTNNETNEFWHAREKEVEEANKAMERFREGYSGGILLVGERYSGKTSLANYISSKFTEEQQVFRINAQEQGSTSPDDLMRSLQQALMFHGNVQQLFNNIPPESVVFFDNLELWWEKSENGMQVLYQIMDIIEQFSHRILFIVALNQHTYKLISQIYPIGNYFLGLIKSGPMTAQELFNIVLHRHRSTGMQLKYKNKEEAYVSTFEYANLFTKYFSQSKGNVGVALQAWISCIQQVEENVISIVAPEEPPINALKKVDRASNMLLLQLVLHRRLNIQRLERIMLEPVDNLQKKLNYLKRSGVIQENAKGVLSINRYMYPTVVEQLKELELL